MSSKTSQLLFFVPNQSRLLPSLVHRLWKKPYHETFLRPRSQTNARIFSPFSSSEVEVGRLHEVLHRVETPRH